MLVAVIAFLVLGEWPRANDRARTPTARLVSAWVYLGAGLFTFVLSGLLGMVLMYRSPIVLENAYQNLMPAFVGLFTVPGILQLMFFGTRPPAQDTNPNIATSPYLLVRGTLTGMAGGLFASILPVVSGGIGGLLAGHATAQRDDRLFLISQGASKVGYYIGSLVLLFVPGLTLTRGGLAAMLTTTYVPYGWHSYWLAVGSVALCGALAIALLGMFSRWAAILIPQINIKYLAGMTCTTALLLVLGFTGLQGLAVLAVATAIGCVPLVFGGRRLNCLGVILIPVTLNIIGLGPIVAQWLGLA
jgi:putative membrane protein